MNRHRTNAPTAVLLALGSTFASLGAAEGLLRLFAPLPLEDQSLRLGVDHSEPGVQSHTVYERNAFGFRSLSMQTKHKPPATLRVIVLGASTTDQVAQDTEDTWSGLLERKLNQAFASEGVRVEVAAYGRAGDSATDLLRWSRANLERFQPDLVITLLGINDLAWKGGPGYRYDGLETALTITQPTFRDRLKETCKRWLQLCRRARLVNQRLRLWLALRRGEAVEWSGPHLDERRRSYQGRPYVEAPVREPDPIREFSDAMQALAALVRSSGIEMLVLGQPVLWKPDMTADELSVLWFSVGTPSGAVRPSPAWLEREMARYNSVQKAHAVREGAEYLNLDPRIPKTLEYYFDDCHVTDRGSRRMADVIFPVAERALREALSPQPAP